MCLPRLALVAPLLSTCQPHAASKTHDTMPHDILYDMGYATGKHDRIPLSLDSSGSIAVDDGFEAPDWARLTFHQCAHCTLDPATHTYCPIARNIAYLFPQSFSGNSWENVELVVETKARRYTLETTLQRALGSLFGLVCSLSDCPHTRPLRAMGTFHLPVSSDQETLVRAAAFFLLKRYLDHQRDATVGVDLAEMATTYKNLKILNRGLAERFRGDGSSDAAVNAIVLLDILARDVDFELEDQLDALRDIFAA